MLVSVGSVGSGCECDPDVMIGCRYNTAVISRGWDQQLLVLLAVLSLTVLLHIPACYPCAYVHMLPTQLHRWRQSWGCAQPAAHEATAFQAGM